MASAELSGGLRSQLWGLAPRGSPRRAISASIPPARQGCTPRAWLWFGVSAVDILSYISRRSGAAVADEKAVERLRSGVVEWRRETGIRENLSDPDLSNADLSDVDLSYVDLSGANLNRANLFYAMLDRANLSGANLSNANLSHAFLSGANLSGAVLYRTIFGNVYLTGVVGLETCRHLGPSIIDHQTLQMSGQLPLAFLRGVGLPDKLIEYPPSLFNQAVQLYSCFISYSSKDDEFANRIHADGVRCWFAPHDLRIGDKILDAIDDAIRLREKVVLILSEHSIKSDWVEDEVTAGFEEERKRGQTVLFPVRLDEAVMNTKEAWAAKLRARHIGDFRKWKDRDAYKQSFERVMCDLTVPPAK
jgi:uncharacterized protein YjbI with pentapeptide repeats